MSEKFDLEAKIKNLQKLKDAIDEQIKVIASAQADLDLFDVPGAEDLKTEQQAEISAAQTKIERLIKLIDLHIIKDANVQAEMIKNGSQELDTAIRALTSQAFKDRVKQSAGVEFENETSKVVSELDELSGKTIKDVSLQDRYDTAVKKEKKAKEEYKEIEAYIKFKESGKPKEYTYEDITNSATVALETLDTAKATLEEANKVESIKTDKTNINNLISSLKNVPTNSRDKKGIRKRYCENLKVTLTELRKLAKYDSKIQEIVEKIENGAIIQNPDSGEISLGDRGALEEALNELKSVNFKQVRADSARSLREQAYTSISDELMTSPILLLQAEEDRKKALEAINAASKNGKALPKEVEDLITTATGKESLDRIAELENGSKDIAVKLKEIFDLQAKRERLEELKGKDKEVVDTDTISIAGVKISDVSIKVSEDRRKDIDFADYVSEKGAKNHLSPVERKQVREELLKNEGIRKAVNRRYQREHKAGKFVSWIRDIYHRLTHKGVSYEEDTKMAILDGMIRDSAADRLAHRKEEESRNPWELDDATKVKIQTQQKNAMRKAREAVVKEGKTAEEALAEAQKGVDDMEL